VKLETLQSKYDVGSEETAETRESAGKAKAELEWLQEYDVPEPEPMYELPDPGSSREKQGLSSRRPQTSRGHCGGIRQAGTGEPHQSCPCR
jgi:hypothetical protein